MIFMSMSMMQVLGDPQIRHADQGMNVKTVECSIPPPLSLEITYTSVFLLAFLCLFVYFGTFPAPQKAYFSFLSETRYSVFRHLRPIAGRFGASRVFVMRDAGR